MESIVLCNRGDEKSTIEELKYSFVRDIIEQSGVPLDDVWPEDKFELDINEKIELRQLLKTYEISIIDDHDGGIKIYLDKEIIAEWKKSRFELNTDLSQVDPSKRVYIKIITNYNSVFEQGE